MLVPNWYWDKVTRNLAICPNQFERWKSVPWFIHYYENKFHLCIGPIDKKCHFTRIVYDTFVSEYIFMFWCNYTMAKREIKTEQERHNPWPILKWQDSWLNRCLIKKKKNILRWSLRYSLVSGGKYTNINPGKLQITNWNREINSCS